MNENFVLNFLLLFSSYIYIGVFFLIVLSGFGFPLPEEITLLAAGVLTKQAIIKFVPMLIFCAVAVFISDMVPYLAGIFYGKRILSFGLVRKFVPQQRMRKISKYFGMYGYRKVFVLRPVMFGIRPFIMLFCGMTGMKFKNFFMFQIVGEFAGILIWVGLGRLFAANLASATLILYKSRDIVGVFIAVVGIVYLFNRFVLKKKSSASFDLKLSSVVFSLILLVLLGYEVFVFRHKIKSFLKRSVNRFVTDIKREDE